jgi:hypothetical protein
MLIRLNFNLRINFDLRSAFSSCRPTTPASPPDSGRSASGAGGCSSPSWCCRTKPDSGSGDRGSPKDYKTFIKEVILRLGGSRQLRPIEIEIIKSVETNF